MRIPHKGEIRKIWQYIKKKDPAPGYDGVGVEQFESDIEQNLHDICNELRAGSYEFNPLIRYFDRDKERFFHIATIRDKIVLEMVKEALEDVFEPHFSPHCIAYRKGFSVYTAIGQLQEYLRQDYQAVLLLDIQSYFDSILREKLLSFVSQRFSDSVFLDLLHRLLYMEVIENNRLLPPQTEGIPQGLSTSPILSNIYLDEFDKSLEANKIAFVRYADDIAVLLPDMKDKEKVLNALTHKISTYGLKFDEKKAAAVHWYETFEYLGVEIAKDTVLTRTNREKKVALGLYLKTLYVQEQGATIGKEGSKLVVSKGEEKLHQVFLDALEHIILLGNIQITSQAIKECMKRNIQIIYLSKTGNYYGRTADVAPSPEILKAQILTTEDMANRVSIAQTLIAAKAHNMQVYLERMNKQLENPAVAVSISRIKKMSQAIPRAKSIESLLGCEGKIAAEYFKSFGKLIKNKDFVFTRREKHPPPDPVNSLLSFGYTLLSHYLFSFVCKNGLSPSFGYLHNTSKDRPSLVLDQMENFRTPIVDSVVLFVINSNIIKKDSFLSSNKCLLTPPGMEIFLTHFEKRLEVEVTIDKYGSRLNYFQLMDRQIMAFKDFILGKSKTFEPYLWTR